MPKKSIPFEKSFASNVNSKNWSKTNLVQPADVRMHSNKKFNFDCIKCGHSFEAILANIGRKTIYYCPFCSNRKLCDNDECKLCFDKSFASHKKVNSWSDKNILKPRDVFLNSNAKGTFKCDVCNHFFDAIVADINRGRWCNFCTNKLLCNDNECKLCFEKSFASHPKHKYWSKKNNVSPREVFKCSNKKYYFKCNECKFTFCSILGNIFKGKWCPNHINKTEKQLYNILSKTYPSLDRGFKPEWSINNKTEHLLPFDFVIPQDKIIIELDGPQHFRQVSNWSPSELYQERDKYKMRLANLNGYSVIRVVQEEMYRNKNYDYDKIIDTITFISKRKKKPATNYFICDNNEYDVYNC